MSLLMVRMRQSLLAGYFLSGVLIANSGALGLVGIPAHEPLIAHLGEVGVILLMFTLGLEFRWAHSLGNLEGGGCHPLMKKH